LIRKQFYNKIVKEDDDKNNIAETSMNNYNWWFMH
jgi:hypothetical protein